MKYFSRDGLTIVVNLVNRASQRPSTGSTGRYLPFDGVNFWTTRVANDPGSARGREVDSHDINCPGALLDPSGSTGEERLIDLAQVPNDARLEARVLIEAERRPAHYCRVVLGEFGTFSRTPSAARNHTRDEAKAQQQPPYRNQVSA